MPTFWERYRQTFNKRGEHWYSIVLGYPLGRFIAVLLAPVRVISPNAITWLGFLCKLGAAGLLYYTSERAMIAFVVCMTATQVLDCVDGSLARVRRQFGPLGAFLDKATDQLGLFLIGAMVGMRAYAQTGNAWFIVAACAGGAGNLHACYIYWVKEALEKAYRPVAPADQAEKISGAAPSLTWGQIGREWLLGWPRIFLFSEADLYFWIPLLCALGRFDWCAVMLGGTQMATALVQSVRYGVRLHGLGKARAS